MDFLFPLCALILAAAAVFAAFKGFQSGRLASEAMVRLETEKAGLSAEINRLRSENEKLQGENLSLERQNSGLLAELKNGEEAGKEQERRFGEIVSKVEERLKNTAQEMLKERSADFSKSNAENMEGIVKPLKEFLEKSQKEMADNILKQGSFSGELKAQIEKAAQMSELAKNSAEELSRAFRHESKVQGDWGETVLNELFESQGLKEGIHYDIQKSILDANGKTVKSEDGKILRPDVILHLDQKREVIIDSKVSLSAYLQYANAQTDADRQKFLKEHLASLQRHVDELSKKDYSHYICPPKEKVDYVIMFVPHSEALWTALREAPTLWREAMQKKVYIADEQTLYAALRIIELTWTRIRQVQNQQKVFDLAGEMLDRVGKFVKQFDDVGASLEKARESYENAQKKLSPSGKSILQTCGKLKALGAKENPKNPLPELDGDEKILGNGEIG